MKKVRTRHYSSVATEYKPYVDEYAENEQVPFLALNSLCQRSIKEDLVNIFERTKSDDEIDDIAKHLVYKAKKCEFAMYDLEIEFVVWVFEDDEKDVKSRIPEKLVCVFEENGLNIASMNFIIEQVSLHNNKLKTLLESTAKDGKKSWKYLNHQLLREAIKIYNNASIDLRTKEIINL